MGCGASDQTPPPQPQQKKEPTKKPVIDDEGDSDFLFFIKMESDSDEIKLNSVEEGYPDPTENTEHDDAFTLNISDDENTDENENNMLTQKDFDEHARKAPPTAAGRFEDLIAYLEEPFKNHTERDKLLVRAILVWLSNQNVNLMASKAANTDSPAGYLALLAQKRTTYSTFFTELCRKGGILCAQIHGICKAGDYQPGDMDENKHWSLWNAVYLNEKWRIVHPFWACCSVFGKSVGGWIKLEASGQSIGKRTVEAPGTLQNAFEDYYINPNPTEFLYACHPDDTKWQLLKNPINRKEFLERAYLLPPFWEFDMELNMKDRCSLTSNNGEITLSFSSKSKYANELDLWYELLLKENASAAQTHLLNPENIPKLVSLVRNTPEWNCTIQFPEVGEYKIVFYGGKFKQTLLRIAEFQLICKKKIQNCQPLPFNPGRMAIGPGPATTAAGLIMPSHKNGTVNVDKYKPTTVRFFLDSDISKKLVVKTELITNESMADEALQTRLNESVKWSIEQSGQEQNMQVSAKELVIETKPDVKGDCYLRISTGYRSNRRQSTDVEMSVVCNYHLTTLNNQNYEYGSKRFARRNLLVALEGNDMDEIEKCILQCEKSKIKEDDPDIQYARNKLEILSLRKAIHDAKQRRHLKVTEQTIQKIKNSQFERIFRRDVEVLEEFAESLRSLNGYTAELPILLDALLELCNRNVSSDVAQNVLTALLILFGVKVDPEWGFEDIQIHCRRLYKRILSQKESSLEKQNAQRSKTVLEKYTSEETKANTMAATKMYNWINDVSNTVLKDYETANTDSTRRRPYA